MATEQLDVPIESVIVHGRVRIAKTESVAGLVQSIKEVGLINRLTVTREPEGSRFWLTAGLHRLEALKALGWTTVPVNVMELSDLDRIIVECDENLRRFISVAETAKFTNKRKEAYEAKYPETRHGAAPKAPPSKDPNLGTLPAPAERPQSFVAATAKATGKSETAVERDALRGKAIQEDVLDALAGTAADTGTNLDKLAKVAPAEQQAAALAMIEEAKAKVTARKERPADSDVAKVVRAVKKATNGITTQKLADETNVDKNVIGRVMTALTQAGEVDVTGKGTFQTVPWFEKLMMLADDAPNAEEYKKGIAALGDGVFHGVSFTVRFDQ